MRKKKLRGIKSGESFGQYLSFLRVAAGYSSLSQVADAAKKSAAGGLMLSKARLSLYERGQIDTMKPPVLKSLAKLYRVPYSQLAMRWFEERYLSDVDTESLPLILDGFRSILLRSQELKTEVTLLSLAEVARRQSLLTAGTHVLVYALHFLDDSVYFDMVSDNLAKGVRYTYVLPERERPTYNNLVSRLGQRYSRLKGRLNGECTQFIPRFAGELPFNGVVFIHPSGRVDGYLGVLGDDRPCVFQQADDRLAMRLKEGIEWHIKLASNPAFALKLHETVQLTPEIFAS